MNDRVENESMYLLKFNSEISRPKLSSTYKLYLLKCLLDLSEYSRESKNSVVGSQWINEEDQKLKVNLNFVAIRFIKYYANLYFKFRLKQSHNPTDVNIHSILDKYDQIDLRVQKSNTPDEFLKSMTSDEFKGLRTKVIQKSIKLQVLPRLDPEEYLYKRIPRKNYIEVDTALIPFLKRYKTILDAGINYTLTRYLEKINVIPRIAEKVSDSYKRRCPNQKEKNILLKVTNECFYCGKQVNAYDHVIPFNFFYEKKLFNLVPACLECNSVKSDRLPEPDIFNRVRERNQRNKQLTIHEDYYNDKSYQNLYETCRVRYHGNRKLFSVKTSMNKN